MADFPRTSHRPQRSQRVLAKATQRRRVHGLPRSVSFSDLAADPRYRRIAMAACPEDLSEEISALGFQTAADVAACKSPAELEARLASTIDPARFAQKDLRRFLSRSKREALRGYRLMRHAVAVQEPMNQGLRHTPSAHSLPVELAEAQSFAKPSSLQSNQSPAAYLRYLYRIATGRDQEIGIVSGEGSPYAIANRRPDLASLRLTEANLKKEIPTIDLVNEVLSDSLGDMDMGAKFFPIALPYDHAMTTARTALAQIGGTRLNDVAVRTMHLAVESFRDHRWAKDISGLLGVMGGGDRGASESVLTLISEDGSSPSSRPLTLEGLYNTDTRETVSRVDHLMSSLDLDFDGLAQILGLYSVTRDSGEPVEKKEFATAFLANERPIEMTTVDGVRYVQMTDASLPDTSMLDALLSVPDLRALNYLARLHHSSGLAFHDLNTILALPGAAAGVAAEPDDPSKPSRRVTAAGLRLLASYPLYRDAYGLAPPAFTALFGEISPYWRADQIVEDDGAVAGLEQTEISFLRSLFGDSAPYIDKTVSAGDTSIADEELANTIARGLGLSALELAKLVSALDGRFALTGQVDGRGLGALYRLSTVFRMLGWPVLEGLDLVRMLSDGLGDDARLWTALTARNETETETDALLSALDWVVALSQWMEEAGLTPASMIAFLAPSPKAEAGEDDITWLGGLEDAFTPHAAGIETFDGFDKWQGAGDDGIPPEIWHQHMLGTAYRRSGVFLAETDSAAIEDACRACLIAEGVNPDHADNVTQLLSLVERLDGLRNGQNAMIVAQIAALDPQISVLSAEPLMTWFQSTGPDLLDALLQGHEDPGCLHWLSEIERHIAVVSALQLGDVDLWLLANRPHWIAPELAGGPFGVKPLDLAQLYWLQRFAAIQVGAATDAAWRGYLAQTNERRPDEEASQEDLDQWTSGCRQTLALLLGCPAEDAAIYLDALFGAGSVAGTIAQIDALAAHVRLADELKISASDLLALKAVSDSDKSGDWGAAAAAVQSGLSRFDGGRQVPSFRKRLAELHRDALVAAFMQTKIANDETLRADITDREKLYTYLLLDVNVTSAVPTSRLVEATHSLQLYISRVLAGLEPEASLNADGYDRRTTLAAQWEIDKDYRQWEANKKLQLYPQNYIEPELRQITSPEFDTLLQSVSGGDISPDSVEAAVNAYMNGLAGACDLSVCSLHVERHPGGEEIENATYHILAKAKWEPGRFFYRKLDADYQTIDALKDPSPFLKAMDWTYWREVSIPRTFDLFSDVTVCVFKNRYYFFWLELEERREQENSGPKTYWRLHPRYMRCDQNALTGPMLTPEMTFEGTVEVKDQNGDFETLDVDGAFQWSGARPELYATYHPTRAPDGLVYKDLHASDGGEGMARETLTVTFGVELASKVEDANAQRTALHIRLSDEWSDAIMDLSEGVSAFLPDVAPAGYSGIAPRPIQTTRAIAEQYNIKQTLQPPQSTQGHYIGDVVEVFNRYRQGTSSSTLTFTPAPRGSSSLGSLDISLNMGSSDYELKPTTTIFVGHTLVSKEKIQVGARLFVDFMPQNGTKMSAEIKFETGDDKSLFKTQFVLPDKWVYDHSTLASLSVRAEVERSFGDVTVKYYSRYTPDPYYDTMSPEEQPPTGIMDLGTFILHRPEGKDNVAWAQTGEHGCRNFLHLTDKESRSNDRTFVVSNSSSVLSGLAKTMPRPGGCESLFTPENQVEAEDFGTFFKNYPATLDALYQDDKTELSPERTPEDNPEFNFDSAYGTYGWEVFYHIPSAIAAGYASSGQFDLSLRWLKKIFDPQQDDPWRLQPLTDASDPQGDLAFDTGDVIVDPDRIAQDYPFYYQQATIRRYLEVLTEAGDAAYEQQTQESLQRAKALYVSAKQLFADNLSGTLEVLTDTPWTDPTLGDVSVDGSDDFLPPYNEELRSLHATLEARLANLRQWLDLNGEPLEVPLLAAAIDPRQLQRTAKAKLTLRGAAGEEEDEADSPFDFSYVIASVKGYLNNLKLTSYRLQDASEKEGNSEMEEFRMDANIAKTCRAVDLQDFAIEAAERDVAIKSLNVAASSTALTNHVAQTLIKKFQTTTDAIDVAKARLEDCVNRIASVSTRISATLKSTTPNTFGFATGGQNIEQADVVWSILRISQFLYGWDADTKKKAAKTSAADWVSLAADTAKLAAKLSADGLELKKANITLDKEKAEKTERETQHGGAQDLRNKWNTVFGGTSFYNPFREDLEALYADEWAATQELCRLLVRLYEEDTRLTNGATFLRTTNLGSGVQKFNAPHRLALDVERLETAHLQAMLDQSGDSCEARFVLGEIPAQVQSRTALEELTLHGETYFELTDEMFDLFYPGQYDRRIQSIAIGFPSLAKAGLSPHARLTQISNIRYMAPERDRAVASKIRKNRHALQSLTLSSCEVDSRSVLAPEGLLGRFQNTGVQSRWHLTIPTIQELKRSKTGRNANRSWRDAAEKRHVELQEHLTDVDFTVRFSGRWIGVG